MAFCWIPIFKIRSSTRKLQTIFFLSFLLSICSTELSTLYTANTKKLTFQLSKLPNKQKYSGLELTRMWCMQNMQPNTPPSSWCIDIYQLLLTIERNTLLVSPSTKTLSNCLLDPMAYKSILSSAFFVEMSFNFNVFSLIMVDRGYELYLLPLCCRSRAS